MCKWGIEAAVMLGTDFYVFLLAMVLSIVLLFIMVWHVSRPLLGDARMHAYEWFHWVRNN